MNRPDQQPDNNLDGVPTRDPDAVQSGKPGPGVMIANFQLQTQLGRGGMGEVWKAWDTKAERPVVLKLTPPELRRAGEQMARVKSMFRRVHALQHQHICPLYLLGEHPGFGWYLVMKFIDGQTLSAYRATYAARHGSFPVEHVVKILRPVAEALDYAHRHGVIHRDIKPQNILVVGDAQDVQVVDFGLAAEIRTTVSRYGRQQADTSGTRPYMAPEQWKGQTQNAQTDQYALAVVAYELLAGRLPFESADFDILRAGVLNNPPKPIQGQSESLSKALLLGLAKRRDERFSTCCELIAAIEASGHAPAPPRSQPSPASRPSPPSPPIVGRAVGDDHRLPCPVCDNILQIGANPAGKEIRCSGCKTILLVSADRRRLVVVSSSICVTPNSPNVAIPTAPSFRSWRCRKCGVELIADSATKMTVCNYCGNAANVREMTGTTIVSPVGVLPFKVTKQQYERSILEWLIEGDWTPDDILESSVIDEINGIYVPLVLFRGRYDGTWTASAGYDRFEDYLGKDSEGRIVEKTRIVTDWRPCHGTVDGVFTELAFAGKRPRPIAEFAVGCGVEQGDLKDYDPKYVHGFVMQAFAVSDDDLWRSDVDDRVQKRITANCARRIPGDHYRDLSCSYSVTKRAVRVYAPYWLVRYTYKGTEHYACIDGQTSARTHGTRPEDQVRKEDAWRLYRPGHICLAIVVAWLFVFAMIAERYDLNSSSASEADRISLNACVFFSVAGVGYMISLYWRAFTATRILMENSKKTRQESLRKFTQEKKNKRAQTVGEDPKT